MSEPLHIGGYQLLASLGTGGMARVYLAVRQKADGFTKLFVLKVLRPELSDEHVAMFREEAKIAARLNHPNVVQTYEVSEEAGQHFMAMEYLEGQTLSAVLAKVGRSRFPLEAHVRILCDVLEGLHHAHELTDFDGKSLALVHRDVSPQNVFVTYSGLSKLLDFGIAKTVDMTRTEDGVVKGKTGYMAPEQASGQPVDRRADIFAVGVLLWEAVARRRFVEPGEDQGVALWRRIGGMDLPLRDLEPDAPPALLEACEKALARDPANRYPTALAFRDALLGWLRSRATVTDSATVGAELEVFSEERSSIRRRIDERLKMPASSPDLLAVAPADVAGSTPSRAASDKQEGSGNTPGAIVGGRYRLDRAIGSGGMGLVFEATQLDLRRKVAVKLLTDVAELRVERLRQEALLAGSISSPHVVSVFDFQAPPGEAPFLVMERLEGRTLADVLRETPQLDVPRAARIGVQTLLALEAAHAAGFVHRDIKPSNIWLQSGAGALEHVKVLDFGIAKALGEDAVSLTAMGAVPGTPSYIAPEQLRGLPSDERADLHAVGVVLYEMLAGSLPWWSVGDARTLEIVERIPTPPHLVDPRIPVELSQVVVKALVKDPARRWQHAVEMRAALAGFARNASLPAMRAGTEVSSSAGSAEGESTVLVSPERLRDSSPEPTLEPSTIPEERSSEPQALGGGVPAAPATAPSRVRLEGESRSRSRVLFIVVAAAVLLAVGVGLGVSGERRSGGSRPAIAPPSALAVAPIAPIAPVASGEARASSAPATSSAPAGPSTVRVRLSTSPETAELRLDGRVVANPHELVVVPGEEPHVVEASANGYVARKMTTTFERDTELRVTLTRSRPASGAPPTNGKRPARAIDDRDPYR